MSKLLYFSPPGEEFATARKQVMQKPSSFFISVQRNSFDWIVMIFLCLLAAPAFSQGFGMSKTQVTLRRKLPSVIHLTSTTISVRGAARTPQQNEAAQLIGGLLQTELVKDDHTLTVDNNSPNVKINLTITNLETPQRQTFTRDETDMQKNGKPVVVKKTVYRYIGSISVDMTATDKSGRTLDAGNFTSKYSREFESGNSGGVVGGATTGVDATKNTFGIVKRKLKPGSTDDSSDAPPTQNEVQQRLVEDIVSQIAPRMVNTDEKLEISLARGKLDDADKLATGGLWNRDLETLETMTPLGNQQDDAYRQYNIGVANEALGYKAEDHASAERFFEDAAIGYGKAIDAKPTEKNFILAQTRIQLAVAYYKRLNERGSKAPVEAAGPPSSTRSAAPVTASTPSTTKANTASGSATRSSGGASSTKTSTGTPATNKTTAGTTPSGTTTSSHRSTSTLTNAKVIEMFKSGVEEQNIISAIHDAHSTQFDLSADGLIDLAKNGVKGKIVDAMRARGNTSTPPGSPGGRGN
jgi:hypothetical protein